MDVQLRRAGGIDITATAAADAQIPGPGQCGRFVQLLGVYLTVWVVRHSRGLDVWRQDGMLEVNDQMVLDRREQQMVIQQAEDEAIEPRVFNQ